MAQSNSSDSTQMEVMEVCLDFPPKIYTSGVFELFLSKTNTDPIWEYSGTILQLQISVIFALTQSFHFVFRRLGLPMLIAEIATGITLGQTILGNEKLLGNRKIAYSEDSVQVLGTVSAFGYMFFLFLSAVKMDMSLIRKVGNKALCLGILSVFVPLLSGLLVDLTLASPEGENVYVKKNKNFFLAICYSGSSFPVIHCLLCNLKIINSELGRLSLSVAMISDISSLILMNISYLIQISHDQEESVLSTNLGLTMIFILIMAFVFRPTMNWMVRHIPEGGPISDVFLYAIIVLFLLSPNLSSWLHTFILFGPMILGLVVPDGPPLGSALVEKFEHFVNGLFLPLFVTTCAMRVDFFQLDFSDVSTRNQVIVFLVMLAVKFGVSLALPFYCNMPKRDSLALAFIMNAKGIVELGSFSMLNDNRFISESLFAFLTIVIIIMAAASPILVKLLYDPSRKYAGYQKRNIMQCILNHEELRLLACVHLPSNVTSILNLLNSSCPTSENPLHVNVLHLIKLVGRATPVFISHQKNKKIISNNSYSENVIVSFNQFQRENWGAVEVNVSTAVSPPNLMHEDICNLALDELTSFIILPFHRQLSIDGIIESEDQTIRELNCNILKTAPCSVGILVEGCRYLRRHGSKDSSASSSIYSIAMIFLGGNDDREALTLANHFSQDERVGLTVYHLKAPKNFGTMLSEDDTMLDEEMLEDVRDNKYVTYIEEDVEDGPETSMFLRSMVNEHNLIIVGRQYEVEIPQTNGLKEWSEFPELGMIGDLLASPDFSGAYSLLIVQQQQQNFH